MAQCGEIYVSLTSKFLFYIKDVRMRFVGSIEAKADSKGRVFLPAAFRKLLQAAGEEGLILRKDIFQPCLVLYPESVWNEQLNLLRARLNRWNPQHQQLFRQFVSDVEQLTLDANGRLLVPRRYLRMADIEQDVKFIGMDDTIELWNNADTERPFVEAEEFARQLGDIMGSPDAAGAQS